MLLVKRIFLNRNLYFYHIQIRNFLFYESQTCTNWYELSLSWKIWLQILEISRQILALYELWKNYDEKKEISGILEKMPKPKTT